MTSLMLTKECNSLGTILEPDRCVFGIQTRRQHSCCVCGDGLKRLGSEHGRKGRKYRIKSGISADSVV